MPEQIEDIAITGLSLRLPGGVETLDELWMNLLNGQDLVGEIGPERWAVQELSHPYRGEPGRSITFKAGTIGDVSQFDAGFFGISPREAESMDPQQRLALELAWEALENAGLSPGRIAGTDCAVYLGISGLDYGMRALDDLSALSAHTMTGNTMSIAANRLSFKLDLRGPSVAVDTACSSAMVALHHACQTLRAKEAQTALVGSVNLLLHPYPFIGFTKASMLSAEGRCRTFAEGANGYVRAEGGGMMLLRPLADAIREGDQILAVIRASGVNNDGARKTGLTIPSSAAQQRLMQEVLARSGLAPDDIDYLEAHGTGTSIGDPAEARAIGAVYGQNRHQALPIGSVKSNLGHMEAASGIAGLAKALLVLRHGVVPPGLHAETLNSGINFEALGLDVVRVPQTLPKRACRRVAINSFGFGGVNAHVILEAPPARAVAAVTAAQPLVISARNEAALRALAGRYAAQLTPLSVPERQLVAAAAWSRRAWLHERLTIKGALDDEAVADLARFAENLPAPRLLQGSAQEPAGDVAFIYSGNGSQWSGMGRQLVSACPDFARTLTEVAGLILAEGGPDVLVALADESESAMADTQLAQPALFALQVAITQGLRARGTEAVAVMGHSVGEIAAAWASGALSLQMAARVIVARSRAQGATRGRGSMVAVMLGAEDMEARIRAAGLTGMVEIAAINSPSNVTVSGSDDALTLLLKSLHGVVYKHLGLDYAFHSAQMDPIQPDLAAYLTGLQSGRGSETVFYSSITAGSLAPSDLTADYWWQNVRAPVLFGATILRMAQAGCRVFVEIGPHAILQRYIKEAVAAEAIEARILATAPHRRDTLENLEAAALGVTLAGPAPAFEAAPTPHATLPSYPWQRQRYWAAPTIEGYNLFERHAQHELLGYRLKEYPAAWEVHLDSAKFPALADHKVGGAVVLAGAAYLEMALVAAREWYGHDRIVVEDLRILAPIVFEGGHTRTLRLIFSPEDLRFQIEGRSRLADVPWTIHARGRLLEGEATTPLASIPAPVQPMSISRAQHYATAKSLGLEYGPSYQGLAGLWMDAHIIEADLGWLSSAPTADGRYIMHPAIMDQCFQAMLGWVTQARVEMGYLPISFERLRVWPKAGPVVRLRGRLRRFSRHAAAADFELLNEAGGLVALLEGARFRAASLHRREMPPGRWITRAVPQALQGFEAALPEWSFTVPAHAAKRRFYAEALPFIEMLPLAYIRDALCVGGTALESVWAHGSAWQRWLLALARSEALIDVDGGPQGDDLPATIEIWRTALAVCPDAAEWLLRIGRVGMALVANPWQEPTVLSEKSDMIIASPLQTDADEAMLAALKALLKVWPRERRVRILDIGTNGPCWFNRLRSVLPDRGVEFVVARQDESLCAGLQADLAGAVEVISLDPSGFSLTKLAADRFDLILMSHVLHDVSAYKEVLHQITGRLAQDGLLFMTECAPDTVSRFTNEPNPAAKGLEPCHVWEERLLQSGLVLRTVHQNEEALEQDIGGFLLVAGLLSGHEPKPSAVLDCMVLAEGELADSLRWKIEDAGGRVTSEDELSHPAHIIIFAASAAICPTASELAHLCEQLRVQLLRLTSRIKQARIWVVTSGGALLDVPGSTPVRPGNAALWGLVRSAASELAPSRIALVDLPDFSAIWADALFAELAADGDETEILFTPAGRFVTRTVKVEEGNPVQAGMGWRLDFTLAGQLRNLQWTAADRPAPKEDEIEIEALAAGLNFRDLMFATGLLPEEALENGFAGPTLGLEVAGRVARVGAKVTEFQPGESVLAFAGGSLAGYVSVPARTAAKCPENWSFTEAATVPTVFFTVWYALVHLARLEPGETVLIHGAAGGVGVAAIQIAKLLGARVVASAGTQARRDFALLLGAELAINSRSQHFDQELLDITGGEGVDIIINSLAGEAINRNLRLMKPFGRFIELGKRDFYENTAIGLKPFRNNVSYFGVDADQLMKVRPALARRVFGEVMQKFAEGALHPLPARIFPTDEVVNAFRYMQQAKQVGKVVVDLSVPPHVVHGALQPNLMLKAEATYLVTGGLSGFGLETALWLVAHGARHLALLSRRGETAEATAKLESARAQGVEIRSFVCDVTNRAELASVLATIEAEMKNLAGIIHAAMVLDDAMLPALTEERFRAVLAPKIDGAWALHELTLNHALDMFLLFSSGTTLLGNPGQANYVAANAALEGLALLRQQQGLAACCIGWGPIADVGVLTRNETARNWLEHKLGITPLRAARALRELNHIGQTGPVNCAVMELDWGVLQARLPNIKIPRFVGVGQHAGPMASEDSEELALRLKSLPETEARQVLVEVLEAEIAGILRLPIERIRGAQSLFDFGLDSLMAMEFALALEKHLGVTVQPMLISESPSLEAIASRLLAMVRGGREIDGADLLLQEELKRHGESLEDVSDVK